MDTISNDSNKEEEISNKIKEKVSELNNLIEIANNLDISVYLIQAQKTNSKGLSLYNTTGVKIYKVIEY